MIILQNLADCPWAKALQEDVFVVDGLQVSLHVFDAGKLASVPLLAYLVGENHIARQLVGVVPCEIICVLAKKLLYRLSYGEIVVAVICVGHGFEGGEVHMLGGV